MTQHVCVRVSGKAGFVRNLHASNDEAPAGLQAMQIVSSPDSRYALDPQSRVPNP